MARTLAGDSRAFGEVVRRHGPAVRALCARMTRDPQLGEELAQESLARAFAGLRSFRGDSGVRHWLMRIAANGCRDWRRAGARAERPAALSGDELVTERDPERDIAARQACAALAAAVAALPPTYRDAFTLFHVESLPYEAIEALTGVKANAVKVRVHRARAMLRLRLGELLDAPAPG